MNQAWIKHEKSYQNSYLGLILTATHYAFIIPVPFVYLADPILMPNIPVWTPPVKEKRIHREHKYSRHQYN